MNIIVTHDIDHLSVKEHLKDLTLIKFLMITTYELLINNISINTFLNRIMSVISGIFTKNNRWNNLNDLISTDKRFGIKSTFFIAVEKGKGISYDKKQAEKATRIILKSKMGIGLHYQNEEFEPMKKEFEQFRNITKKKRFPVRKHYLINDEKTTLHNVARLKPSYDSSLMIEDALKIKQAPLKEIPINIMDTYLFSPLKKNLSLKEAKRYTADIIRKAKENDGTIMIDTHQIYYDEKMFPRYRKYYDWLVEYLAKNDLV